ncbi:MAG: hypothetical protein HZC37_26020 [Burkholderiales bacterium]|nr:hypothetical protein [Burkholderiales bacterium]
MSDGAFARWLEWLRDLGTYAPSDFLMFAPRTYWRLFELHNEAWWPLPLMLPGIGLAALAGWSWRGGAAAQRGSALGLAAAAAFVGFEFVLERYAAINWAAKGLAVLWITLGLLLLALAASRGVRVATGVRRQRAAAVLALWALFGQPLLAPLAGRPLAQAEVFGLAPDPTMIAILAWLLAGSVAGPGPVLWLWRGAWCMALAYCLSSAATLALLDAWHAALAMAASTALAVLASLRAQDKAA